MAIISRPCVLLLACLPLFLAKTTQDLKFVEHEAQPPTIGGGEFSAVGNLKVHHEESHIHPEKREYRTLTGNHQPFPDVVSFSFEAFGETFHYPELPLLRGFLAENAHVEVLDADHNVVEKLPFKHQNYARHYENGDWISAQMHTDEHLTAHILREGRMYQLNTVKNMRDNPEMQGDEADAQLVDMGLEDQHLVILKMKNDMSHLKCGVNNEFKVENGKLVVNEQGKARKLLQDDWAGEVWGATGGSAACFTNFAGSYQEIGLHLIADNGLSANKGGQIQAYLAEVMAATNVIYRGQMHISIKTEKVTVLAASSGKRYNNCGNTINAMLDELRVDHGQSNYQANNYGMTAVLNRCWAYGTVGLAYVGAICGGYGASVSSSQSSTHLLTFAHELGHNFGGGHSFEEGQGSTGGIMDYGDGIYLGRMQFNTKHRKREMCDETISPKVGTWCFAEKSLSTCGNGLVDDGEDCDGGSCCSSSCKWNAGASCETDGACCVACKPSADCGWCKWSGSGQSYAGLVATTESGKTCQKWSAQSPHAHQYSSFFQGQGDHNYCRNPLGVKDRPFCYTNEAATRTEYCDVGTTDLPKCGGAQGSGVPGSETAVPTAGPSSGGECTDEPANWADPDGTTCAEYVNTWNLCADGARTQPVTFFQSGCGSQGQDDCKGTGGLYAYEACCECGGGNNGATSCETISPPTGAQGDSCINKMPGDKCTFTCASGSNPANAYGTRTCAEDFSWTGEDFACTQSGCPDLTAPTGATGATCSGKGEGETCTFACTSGYTDNGFTTRTCSGGQWTGSNLVCTAMTCPNLLTPNGATGDSCVSKKEGEKCTFACSTGTPSGTPERTCTNGAWSGSNFACTQATQCPELQSPTGAVPQKCVGKEQGDTCRFECGTGYIAVESPLTEGEAAVDNSLRTCQADLSWSGEPFRCQPAVCPELKSPSNAGAQTCLGKAHGQTCTFSCLAGFSASGDSARECSGGSWLGEALTCQPLPCPDLKPPENSDGADCTGYLQGQVCAFSCKAGFNTAGDPSRTCQNGGWSGFTLVCTPSTTRYTYIATQWSSCSADCGGGKRTRVVNCVDTQEANKVVDSSNCASAHPVTEEEVCNSQLCADYAWVAADDWDECSVECGGGLAYREVECQTGGYKVDDSYCSGSVKLDTQIACNPSACPVDSFHWASGQWSECSEPCGGGKRARSVGCRDHLGNVEPDPTKCTKTQPAAVGDCNTGTCDELHAWTTCPFEECTAECGGAGGGGGLMSGTQNRQVMCLGPDKDEVSDALCSSFGSKPTSILVGCNPQPCSEYNWMTTPWSRCTGNKRLRTYHCHDKDGGNAENSECPQDRIPTTEEECSMAVCPDGSSGSGGNSDGGSSDSGKTDGGNLSGAASLVASPVVLVAALFAYLLQ